MSLYKYNFHGKIETPLLVLCKPNKETVGILRAEPPVFNLKFNSMNDVSFNIYKYINGDKNLFYDQVKQMKLVDCSPYGWYQITECAEIVGDEGIYKQVKALSLENELTGKSEYDINGTFKLYDVSNTDKSLLHIIANASGNWTIGHVSNSLLTKWRTFSIDTGVLYNLLVNDISTSFECIFQFDTYTRKINAYTVSEFNTISNIVMTYENLIMSSEMTPVNFDEIITVMRVVGGDELDIRAVNPSGKNTVMNVSSFMDTEYMSQELIDSLKEYKTKTDNVTETYTTGLAQKKVLQAELSELNNRTPKDGKLESDLKKYGLTELNSLLYSQETLQGTMAKAGASSPSHTNYQAYLTCVNKINAINSEIIVRQSQINAKQTEIDNKDTYLNSLSATLDMDSNFTSLQIDELAPVMKHSDFIDETYVAVDTDTEEEVLQIKQELYEASCNKLAIVSKPRFTTKITSKNMFAINEYTVNNMLDTFELGSFAVIIFSKELYTTARLLSMTLDFRDLSDIDLVFSSTDSLEDDAMTFGEIIADAKSTSTTLSLKGMMYDKASKYTDEFIEYKNSTLDTATQSIKNGVHGETTIDQTGIKNRTWLPNQNKYDDHQSWWNANTLLFSDDGFKTSKAGIGLFTDSSGNNYYSVLADVIAGELIMGSKLYMSNQSGTYTINDDGFSATKGSNYVKFNPNNASTIFDVKAGTTRLYVDGTNNKLKFTGDLEASGGSFSGNLNACGGTFTGTLYGVDGSFSGSISASSISGSTITGTAITGNTITGGTIKGTEYFSENTTNNSAIRLLDGNCFIEGYNGYVRGKIGSNSFSKLVGISSNNNMVIGHDDAVASLYGGARIDINMYTDTFTIKRNSNGGTPNMYLGTSRVLTSDNYSSYINMPSVPSNTNGISASLYESDTYTGTYYVSFSNTYSDTNVPTIGWVKARASSDERLKHNFENLNIYDDYMKIDTYSYIYNDGVINNKIHFGMKANKLNEIFPYDKYDLIEFDTETTTENEKKYCKDGVYRVNYDNLHAMHIFMIQNLQIKVNELEEKLNNLCNNL